MKRINLPELVVAILDKLNEDQEHIDGDAELAKYVKNYLADKSLPKEVIPISKFREYKDIVSKIINPAQDILPRTYDKEIEDYHKWNLKNL